MGVDGFDCASVFDDFDDEHNKLVLEQAAEALRPGGTVVIEMPNRPALLRHYQPLSVIERDGDFLIDQNALDPLTGRSTVKRTIIKDGLTRRVHFFVRLLTYVELEHDSLRLGSVTSEGSMSRVDH